MKKNLLFLIVMCFLTFPVLNAQLTKGRIMVGVSSTIHLSELGSSGTDLMGLGFVTAKDNDDYNTKISYFNLLPKAGYFVIDNLAVGLDIIVSTMSQKDVQDDDKYTGSMLSVGPFVRYYYPLEKFYPFVELNVAFGTHKDKWTYGEGDDTEKYGLMTFGGGVGAAFPLGDRVTFDVMAGYTSMTYKDKENDYKETIGGIGLRMGFMVYFGSE